MPLGQGQTDPARADQPERFPVELRAVERLLLPQVLFHRHVGPAVLADGPEHEAEGVFGHGNGRGRGVLATLMFFSLAATASTLSSPIRPGR